MCWLQIIFQKHTLCNFEIILFEQAKFEGNIVKILFWVPQFKEGLFWYSKQSVDCCSTTHVCQSCSSACLQLFEYLMPSSYMALGVWA